MPAAAGNIAIDPINSADFDEWQVLWDGNNQGNRDSDVTAQTWLRLLDPQSPVKGLVARQQAKMIGLVHYILHPVTGHLRPVCYMQDLYVAPAARSQGVGRALVEQLAALGQQEQWARLYWLAESKNKAAQALYKTLGVKLDFSLHVWPL